MVWRGEVASEAALANIFKLAALVMWIQL